MGEAGLPLLVRTQEGLYESRGPPVEQAIWPAWECGGLQSAPGDESLEAPSRAAAFIAYEFVQRASRNDAGQGVLADAARRIRDRRIECRTHRRT